jgi:ATP-binding cassette subfamily B protein
MPTEGEVLVDGHSTLEYNRDDLYTMFSLIPQHYTLFPYSIAQNIALADLAGGERIDYDRVRRCVEIAGLSEKVESLPMGLETPFNRQLYPEAVELSGGETQKLLLARALYREAPVMILDEPTAALDPISEDRMYQKYNEIKNTTSIFISHRLASTRFCDRVFLLDGAHIAESGTHDELISMGGKYKEIFDVQAKYYKEGEENGGKQE